MITSPPFGPRPALPATCVSRASATRSGSRLALTARIISTRVPARDKVRRNGAWYSRNRAAKSGDAAVPALLVVLFGGRRARSCRPRVNRLCVPWV